ncbi:MAG: signal peptidase II [Clostridia bacterium]|nr:signal peptidase II [Clostridia bacterium]
MLEIIVILLILSADQLTKAIAENFLMGGEVVSVIEGVFQFEYVQNTGAAFGMLKDGTMALAIVSAAASLLIGALLITQRRRKPVPMSALMRVAASLLLAGALGNLIDRAFLGYVRDMLSFVLINFPVFNIADSAVCVGVALLLIAAFFTKGGKAYIESIDAQDRARAERKRAQKAALAAESEGLQPAEPEEPAPAGGEANAPEREPAPGDAEAQAAGGEAAGEETGA